MAIETYSQVELKRRRQMDIVWIETKFATVGRYIKVKHNGDWQDGWQVIKVYATRPADHVRQFARDYTRMATYQE